MTNVESSAWLRMARSQEWLCYPRRTGYGWSRPFLGQGLPETLARTRLREAIIAAWERLGISDEVQIRSRRGGWAGRQSQDSRTNEMLEEFGVVEQFGKQVSLRRK